jgi:PAS domain S-box
MVNNLRRKISPRQEVLSLVLYKTLISVSLGLIGFIGTFFASGLKVDQFNLDFVWSLIFPMLVTQAWGVKYGILSSVIGLSAFHSFYLWQNEGWACFVSFLINIVWFILHGYGVEKRKQYKKYIYNIYFIEIFCLLINSVLYFFLFPLSIKYNLHSWYNDAITMVNIGDLNIFFIKRIVQDFFILTGCDTLLLLPSVKKLFLFNIESKSRHNGTILARALAICIIFCFLSIFIEYLLHLRDNPFALSQIVDTRDVIHFIILIMFCMVTGSVTIRYLEKKQKAEELVRQSERKYNDIFENIMNLYIETLINGTIVEISPSVKKILGYEQHEIIGKNIGIIYKELKFRKQILKRLLDEKNIENLEIEVRKKDGTKCVLLVNFRVVNTEDGLEKIICIGRDVTDYVEAKRKETEIQEEYKIIFDKMLEGMIVSEFIYDENGELVDAIATKANQAIEKHLGLKASDAIGNTYIKSLDGNKSTLKKLQNILKTDTPLKYEAFTQRFNRHLLLNVFKLNNKQIGIMFHDISDLKQLEANHREMAERLEAVFESTNDRIYSVDNNYRILNFNSSLKDYIKRNYNIKIEKGQSIFELTSDEVAQEWKVFYDRALSGVRYSFEYYITHEKTYVEVFFNPIYHNREICGTAVFIKDITKRKKAELEIIKINKELEQLVEERTRDLRSTLTELEAFTYTVSHDLKSPLRAIDGYSRIILEDYEETLEKEAVNMITNIANVSCDMVKLIDKVLQYSITSKENIQREKIDIREMFINVFNEIKATCVGRDIEFNIETAIPTVIADKTLIRQVVYNILSNAMKFTKNKDIAIISTGCLQNYNEQIFYIEDNGAGFDMKYSKKLFAMFQRLHNKDEYEGSGIGLATVHKIIQRHGGRTWIESSLNEGTKVFFSLPIE